MNLMASELSIEQINDWFSVGKKVKVNTIPRSALGGHDLDPLTGGPAEHKPPPPQPSYRRNTRFNNPYQTGYAEFYQRQEEDRLLRQSSDDIAQSLISESVIEETYDSLSMSTRVGPGGAGAPHRASGLEVFLPEGMTEAEALKVYDMYCRVPHLYDPNLAITAYRQDIVDLVESNQVTIIQGETGSGKTTQVSQYILDHYASVGRYCNIVVTQPRRIAAISIAARVCSERNWTVGKICGYQVGMKREVSEDTRLLYCTTGVLLQKLIGAKDMNMYTHVILDEVHERDEDSDFCLLLVKKFLNTNSKDVKVVLMSATFDVAQFARYYARLVGAELEPAPVMQVEGRCYDVQEYYLDDLAQLGKPATGYYDEGPALPREVMEIAARLIQELDNLDELAPSGGAQGGQETVRGSILIFMPGIGEIEEMDSLLHRLDIVCQSKLWLKALHSSITGEEQSRVFRAAPQGHRKVILSTNIAESSITIPDIRYVIDFCLTKTNACDPNTNYSSLQLQWASKANCTQRKGRAGRVAKGRVYRMVTNKFWRSEIPEYGIPEMQRSPLDHLVLHTKMLDIGEPKAILGLALAPPNLDDIERTILGLKEIGALRSLSSGDVNPHDGQLTFLGRVLASLPVDLRMGKLMMLGHVFGLLDECIVISACTALKSFFAQPFKSNLKSFRYKFDWAGESFSDCIAYVIAFRDWLHRRDTGQFYTHQDEVRWCTENWLQMRRVHDVLDLVNDLTQRLRKFNVGTPRGPLYRPPDLTDMETRLVLKLVLCGAFYPNYFEQSAIDHELALREISGHNPCTTVMVKGLPLNQGGRYRAQLETKFAWFDDGRKPRIHFEATKAFIEFMRDPTDRKGTNRVLPAVFRAIKVRNVRESQTLMCIDELADKPTLPTPLPQEAEPAAPAVPSLVARQVDLPAPSQRLVYIQSTEVIACGHFWAVYQLDSSDPHYMDVGLQFGRIQAFVADLSTRPAQQRQRQFGPGDFCLAPFDDPSGTSYYRARVEKLLPQAVEIFFLDYGNIIRLPMTLLCPIDPTLLSLPFQAFECELSGIRPSVIKCPHGQWTTEATEVFYGIISHANRLIAEVYSVVHGVTRVELHAVTPEGDSFSVNQRLIAANFADRADESYVSELSHIERDQQTASVGPGGVEALTQGLRPIGDLRSACLARESEMEGTGGGGRAARVRGGQIHLHGPSSPYEIGYNACTFIGRMRPTRVERDSVNSVSLSVEPGTMSPRMLVAASVSLNPSACTLTARDTTLLPSVPGLLPLIALVFTPAAEFRTDKDRCAYTGVLCGLGWDCKSPGACAALPDNDMELCFDIAFDEEDIKLVNGIRIAINLGVGSGGNVATLTDDNVVKIQKKARETLLRLIKRRRDQVHPVQYDDPYQWGQVSPEHLRVARIDDLDNEMILYNLHSLVELQPLPGGAGVGGGGQTPEPPRQPGQPSDKMLHQRDLERRAACGTSVYAEHYCRLCQLMLHSARELAEHLRSLAHRQHQPLV